VLLLSSIFSLAFRYEQKKSRKQKKNDDNKNNEAIVDEITSALNPPKDNNREIFTL